MRQTIIVLVGDSFKILFNRRVCKTIGKTIKALRNWDKACTLKPVRIESIGYERQCSNKHEKIKKERSVSKPRTLQNLKSK
ncbi:MAG: hypothetical protein RSB70_04670 [Clostridium sp.]